MNQDLVYYRSDWFEEYNEGLEEGMVYCRIWDDFPDAQEKLADKGAAGLVFGGQEHLIDLFDSIFVELGQPGPDEGPGGLLLLRGGGPRDPVQPWTRPLTRWSSLPLLSRAWSPRRL